MKTAQCLIILALSFLSSALFANDCFCLVDDNDNFRHSCVMQQQGVQQVAQCRSDGGIPYKMDNLNGWMKLADGVGRCKPCQQLLNIDDGLIRGTEKDSQKTTNARE